MFNDCLECIETSIKQLRQKRQQIKKLEHELTTLEQLFPQLYLSNTGDWAALHLYGQPSFTSDANPKLIETLETIENFCHFDYCNDLPDSNCRVYNYHLGPIQISIYAYLAKDSKFCQRQIVGYDEVEESQYVKVKIAKPRYEFKC